MKKKKKAKKKVKVKAKKKVKSKSKPQSKSKQKKKTKVEISLKGLSIRQVAAVVCSYLMEMGFDPVLTGKGCASIYGGANVQANSLDFVISEYLVGEIEAAMKILDFNCKVHRTFSSKTCPYEVSFLPPPVMVGDDVVIDLAVMQTKNGELRMLSPTDCIRHRLAAYYRFGNQEALKDAVAVASKHDVDMKLVERWSHWEWASDKFEEFIKLLKQSK